MTVDTATLRAQAEALAGIAWRNEDRAVFLASGDETVAPFKRNILALCDALEAERERVRVLTEALQWYADERNYDEIGRPGVYVPGSTAGGFVQDPDWDTDDGWRAERALEAALATAGGEGVTT